MPERHQSTAEVHPVENFPSRASLLQGTRYHSNEQLKMSTPHRPYQVHLGTRLAAVWRVALACPYSICYLKSYLAAKATSKLRQGKLGVTFEATIALCWSMNKTDWRLKDKLEDRCEVRVDGIKTFQHPPARRATARNCPAYYLIVQDIGAVLFMRAKTSWGPVGYVLYSATAPHWLPCERTTMAQFYQIG
jgi:hypothetical protein